MKLTKLTYGAMILTTLLPSGASTFHALENTSIQSSDTFSDTTTSNNTILSANTKNQITTSKITPMTDKSYSWMGLTLVLTSDGTLHIPGSPKPIDPQEHSLISSLGESRSPLSQKPFY